MMVFVDAEKVTDKVSTPYCQSLAINQTKLEDTGLVDHLRYAISAQTLGH